MPTHTHHPHSSSLSSTTSLPPTAPLLPTPAPTHPSPAPSPRTRALQSADLNLDLPPGLGLGLGITPPPSLPRAGPSHSRTHSRRTSGPSQPHSRHTSDSHGHGTGAGPNGWNLTQTTTIESTASYPSWLPSRPVGPVPEGWATRESVLPPQPPLPAATARHPSTSGFYAAPGQDMADLLRAEDPQPRKRDSAPAPGLLLPWETPESKRMGRVADREQTIRLSGGLPSASFTASTSTATPARVREGKGKEREREGEQEKGERQATPRRVQVVPQLPIEPPPPARTSLEREQRGDRRISFPVVPATARDSHAAPGSRRQSHRQSQVHPIPQPQFGQQYLAVPRPSSSGSQVAYHPPSPSAATESSLAPLARPVPSYKHPLFRPALLLDPTFLAKLHYRLLPFLAFAHLPAQVFLDINALYILVLAARFPAAADSGRPWALATAAYALCVFLQLVVVFLLYEILYSFYRRWRPSRPPITPIYLSRPASTLVSLFSFEHYSFINQVRRSAWRSRSPRGPGGWRDGCAETCYLYAQNGWTVCTLLPRGALAVALLLAFWLPSAQAQAFASPPQAQDGLYFSPLGALTTYSKVLLAINAGWAAWRTLILLLSWLGLWALSGLACAGLCGPRNKWEETRWGEKDPLPYWGERDLDALRWGWRERTRERVREAWEFCLVDRAGRRVSQLEDAGVEEARRREGPRMSLEDPSPEPEMVQREKRSSELSRIMQNFLAPPLAPPPSTVDPASAVQSPRLVGPGVFAQGSSGPSSGGQTVLPTPALAGAPFVLAQTRQARQEMRGLPKIQSPQRAELHRAESRQSVAPDLGEAELAARVQQILLDWVDPEEDDALAQALLGYAPLEARRRGSAEEHEKSLSREEQRKREREAIASAHGVLVPIEVVTMAQQAAAEEQQQGEPEEGAGERRSYPPEEGRSASMSSLGTPLHPAQSAFARYRRGSQSQSAASGSAAAPPTHSRGNSQSISVSASVSPTAGHAHTDSTGSQALSDPGVPMLATRFNPSLPVIPPPPHAHHPPSQTSRRRRAEASSGESSPASVADVFVRRPAGEAIGAPGIIREQEGQEHDTGAEGDEEEVSPEEKDSVGEGPSRATSVGRLMRPGRSLRSGSVSTGSSSPPGRSQAEPEPSSSNGVPNRQHRASEGGASHYSDARSHALSASSSPEGSGGSPSEEDEEPIVDRTFGRQSDWTSQLEAEDAPRSVRSTASTRPSVLRTQSRQGSVDSGSPNLTIRRSLPAGSLSSTLPTPIPIRSPPSSHLRPQPSGETISAGSARPGLSSSANESFVTAPIMASDSEPPPVPSYGRWLSRVRPEGEGLGGNPM